MDFSGKMYYNKLIFTRGSVRVKLFSNKKYNVILKYVIITVVITLILITAIFRWDTVKKVFGVFLNVFEPVIWGAVIAFIMNPIMMATDNFFSKKIFTKKPRPKLCRALGVIFATLVFLAVISAIVLSVIPEIISAMPGIYTGITNELIPGVERWFNEVLEDVPSIQTIVDEQLTDILSTVRSILSTLGPKLNEFLSSLLNFANSVKNFVFGIIFAIYFLLSKDALQAQAKKVVVALFREETYHRIFDITTKTNKKLFNFICGKVIDSAIIGVLCGIGMLIFNMPYVMLVSLIIGITNIIPIFGPFIGAIPASVLILIAEPKKVIWFIIFIIVLQQLDGNIIGPKILGSKIGLSSFWMLFSIIIFGSMFGIVGMIVGVPLFAVAYDLINEAVTEKLKSKNMPTDDEYYSMPAEDIGKVLNPPPSEPVELVENAGQDAEEE